MPKKNALIGVSRLSDETNNALVFTVGEAGSFSVELTALSDEIRERALVHGLIQKISDAAAIAKSELSGNAKKDAKTKLDAMQSVADRLLTGDWSKRSGDGSGPVAGLIRRAYAEFARNAATAKGVELSDEAIDAAYDKKTRSEQLALRTVPEIAVIIERLKSERGTPVNVNTDDLLGELGL